MGFRFSTLLPEASTLAGRSHAHRRCAPPSRRGLRRPWVIDVNLRTAQECLGRMQEHGWDIGDMARAIRYLGRARAIDARGSRGGSLERIRGALDES